MRINKEIELKGIIWEDMVNYKKIGSTFMFPKCDFKCDRENGVQLCQNWELAAAPSQKYDIDELMRLYQIMILPESIILQGLEPLDSPIDIYTVAAAMQRHDITDDLVIYTGYNKNENDDITNIIDTVSFLTPGSLIVKWGRYLPNQTSHYDEVLGVKLASDNQFGEIIK